MSSLTEHVARHSRRYRVGALVALCYAMVFAGIVTDSFEFATFALALFIAHFVFRDALDEARRRDAVADDLKAWEEAVDDAFHAQTKRAETPAGGIDSAAHDWWEPAAGKPMHWPGDAAVTQARNSGV